MADVATLFVARKLVMRLLCQDSSTEVSKCSQLKQANLLDAFEELKRLGGFFVFLFSGYDHNLWDLIH